MARTPDDDPIFDVTQSETRKFRSQGKTVTFEAATFEGVLRITDAESLVRAMRNGVGREKAYGCGLLTLARETALINSIEEHNASSDA
jgi:CRISPR system Cascade subunit CasE